jgi:uncharacterized protein (DUF1501 family)
MNEHNHSRRRFVGNMLAMAGGSALPFSLNLAAMNTAAAQTAVDYKALVCVFLTGGNDHFNTVLATDSPSWSEYVRIRTTGDGASIALPGVGASGGVLPITPATPQAGRSFALHPQLGPLKQLFDNGRAAIVANVGPLVTPITLAQYKAGGVALPSKLFSHNDQQSAWQSQQPESSQNSGGWGGRIGDLKAGGNRHATFTCVSTAGNAPFLNGRVIRQYQISDGKPAAIYHLDDAMFGLPNGVNPLRRIITGDQSNLLQKEHVAMVARSISAQAELAGAMVPTGSGGVPDPTPYTNPTTGSRDVNPLALQLQTVAQLIASRNNLGVTRQVFFVSMSGFDTHDNQRLVHADLMARLAHAMTYWDTTLAALQGIDMRKNVTLFTASDFGRTFTSNGDGTDHGWGSHHFVLGGAVKGRDIYGKMPVTGLGHDRDVGSGALLPAISVDQYGGTLADWYGLSTAQVNDVFPNLRNFSSRNLGFMVT